MHIDEGANVQLCQSVRGQMSLHAIFGQGANVRGGTCPTLIRGSTPSLDPFFFVKDFIPSLRKHAYVIY